MARTITIKDARNKFDKLRKQLKDMNGRTNVVVGITSAAGGEVMTYANANEFGAHIKPRSFSVTTYKQVNKSGTGYNKKGRFVKASKANFAETHQASHNGYNIPARPFMRTYYDENMEKIARFAESRFLRVLADNDLTIDGAFNAIGLFVQNGIKKQIRTASQWATPNARSTIRKKGSSKPLIDHGIMINSVTFDIRK